MNQSTHAWIAVEAYKKILSLSKTAEGKKVKLQGLEKILGQNLRDVVVASWLPDSLIKDMTFGHIFKNSVYDGDQMERFKINKKHLREHLAAGKQIPDTAFDLIEDEWWDKSYRVKDNGGHLPARVNSLCQTVRDMFRMGDSSVVKITGIKSKGSEIIAKNLLFTPRNIATNLWMMSHYIADAHMPLHCDNRALGSTAKQKLHKKIEDLWGKQVPKLFHSKEILKESAAQILNAEMPQKSMFIGLEYGDKIAPLKNGSDPWTEAVYICRASFAASFAMVPMNVAAVDDQDTVITIEDVLSDRFCGEERFWNLSKAAMCDAVNSVAMFWLDTWTDFVKPKKAEGK